MNFFEQANEVFAGQDQAQAFALATPDGEKFLAWGETDAGAKIKLIPHWFYLKKKNAYPLWNGFGPLSLDKLLLSKENTIQQPWEKITSPSFSNNRVDWEKLCLQIDSAIALKKLQKVVPSRFVEAEISPNTHSHISNNLFARLCSTTSPNAYKFILRANDKIFFGATPEILFKKSGDSIFVPAIAGTRKANKNNIAQMTKDLFTNQKERHEHALVVAGICETLASLGLYPEHPAEPIVKEYGSLIHLFTPIVCRNDKNISSEQLVQALHPTPAIGGSPPKEAQQFLFENESWDRGLFSSPLLFSFAQVELCLVAIRSALLLPERILFFAGAGYVFGSSADGEWQETENKMKSLQTIFFEEE